MTPRARSVGWCQAMVCLAALLAPESVLGQSSEIRKTPAQRPPAQTEIKKSTGKPLDQADPAVSSTGWATEVVERSVAATGVEITGDANLTRLAISFTSPITYQLFTLPNPHRVIIDAPHLSFRFPPGAGQQGKGLIKAFRYGLFAPGKSRIVIDTTRAVRIDKHAMGAREGKLGRFSIDLVPTDEASFCQGSGSAAPRQARPARLRCQGSPARRQARHCHRPWTRRA